VNIRLDLMGVEEVLQDFWVGSSDAFPLKIADPFVGSAFGDGEREAAFGEA
jgi:hypothetical protein